MNFTLIPLIATLSHLWSSTVDFYWYSSLCELFTGVIIVVSSGMIFNFINNLRKAEIAKHTPLYSGQTADTDMHYIGMIVFAVVFFVSLVTTINVVPSIISPEGGLIHHIIDHLS